MVSIIGLDSDKVQALCDAANEDVDEANKVQIANFLCTVSFYMADSYLNRDGNRLDSRSISHSKVPIHSPDRGSVILILPKFPMTTHNLYVVIIISKEKSE